ncbi:MAG: PD-(D/E)XK nuclease family protein [Nitriliruptoraceae bacterium]
MTEPSEPAMDRAETLRLLEVETAPPGTFGELEPTAPPLTDAQGRIRLSFSRIDLYRTCPRSFRYRYVDRLPSRPSPHLSFGSSVHAALEAFHDRTLPARPDVDALLAALYEHWDASGFADLPREEQVAFYRHAQDVLRRYHARGPLDGRRVVATEAWFELPVAYEAVVVGSIDRVDVDDDGALHVVDYKTNRRARSRADVAGSLQLALYALACRHLYGQLPATVALDFVAPGVTVPVALEELDLEAARTAVLDTAAAIRAERFPTTPNRLCDWCDHRRVCPAWSPDGEVVYGELAAEVLARRRRLTAEVRELRELEAGLARVAEELHLDT